MKTIAKETKMMIFKVLLLAGTILHSGFSSDDSSAVFRYDQATFPKAKPWTSENFKNNPDNFQFAILGDRGGGARPKPSTGS